LCAQTAREGPYFAGVTIVPVSEEVLGLLRNPDAKTETVRATEDGDFDDAADEVMFTIDDAPLRGEHDPPTALILGHVPPLIGFVYSDVRQTLVGFMAA
jgi:hypothetical protein